MANVSENLYDWSNTGASNQPDSADSATVQADMQAIQAAVRGWLAHKGADIVSAATTDLGAVEGLFHDITGNTGPITSFGTVSAGIWKVIKFESTPTITHNATSMILPGGVDFTAAAGDMLMATSEGSGNWRVNWIRRANGVPVVGTQTANTVFAGPTSGAAAAPTFRALVGAESGMQLLETKTISNSATVDFTTGFSSSFDAYVLIGTKVVPQTDATDLYFRASTDGGSNYLATNEYNWGDDRITAGVEGIGGADSAAQIRLALSLGTGTGEHANFTLWLHNLSDTSVYKTLGGPIEYFNSTPAFVTARVGGIVRTTSAINAIRLLQSSGNINGIFSLYGIRKA